MKKLIMSLAIAFFAIAGIQAQENKTVKKESTVKRVVTKEGSNVNVKELKSTDTESGAVIIEGSNKTNQEFNENTRKDQANEVMVDEIEIDQDNVSSIKRQKEAQSDELKSSIKKQGQMADRKKQEFMEIELRMKKELAERQASLEARPKGMNKLKKN